MQIQAKRDCVQSYARCGQKDEHKQVDETFFSFLFHRQGFASNTRCNPQILFALEDKYSNESEKYTIVLWSIEKSR